MPKIERKLRAKPNSLCAILWWALQTIPKHQIPYSIRWLESPGKAVLYKASCPSIGGVSSYGPATALKISMKKGCLLIYVYLPNLETFPIGCGEVKGKANKNQRDKTTLHFKNVFERL